MRYFSYRRYDGRVYIWIQRDDGMERCISIYDDDSKYDTKQNNEWNYKDDDTKSLDDLVKEYDSWTEITKEEAFLEGV